MFIIYSYVVPVGPINLLINKSLQQSFRSPTSLVHFLSMYNEGDTLQILLWAWLGDLVNPQALSQWIRSNTWLVLISSIYNQYQGSGESLGSSSFICLGFLLLLFKWFLQRAMLGCKVLLHCLQFSGLWTFGYRAEVGGKVGQMVTVSVEDAVDGDGGGRRREDRGRRKGDHTLARAAFADWVLFYWHCVLLLASHWN